MENDCIHTCENNRYKLSDNYYRMTEDSTKHSNATALLERKQARTFDYFFQEYIKGFIFVILSSVFILLIPSLLLEPERLQKLIYSIFKRTLDILGSVLGLLISLPITIPLAILIKITSPGPVFYTQERVGKNRRIQDRRTYQKTNVNERRREERRKKFAFGKPFYVYKFRTMVNDAEKATGPVWTTKGDPRVTRLGMFMRKTRLDEIPQFLNVLKGDMSLIGPRPERPVFVDELAGKVDGYTDRLRVKPGITGYAQIKTGYDSSVDSVNEKVKKDNYYIDNRSIWFDVKIIFETIWVVLTGRGAQ